MMGGMAGRPRFRERERLSWRKYPRAGYETHVEASGEMTLTSAYSTTEPPERVTIGTPQDIPSLLDVPPGVIFQRRIPVEIEGVVPDSQQPVPGADLQKAVPPRKDALRLGRDYSVVGSGDVADGFIIINRVGASRELQGKFNEGMENGSVLVCVCLVFKKREPPLGPTTPTMRLVHHTIVAYHRLTLAWRYRGGYHPGCRGSPPVTDLRNASQTLDSQHRESKFIVEGDLRLILLNGGGI